jgi:hypothetical protein
VRGAGDLSILVQVQDTMIVPYRTARLGDGNQAAVMRAASIIGDDMGRCGSGAAETAWSPVE